MNKLQITLSSLAAIVFLFVCFGVMQPQTAQAAACHQFNNYNDVPDQYAPPLNVFNDNLIFEADCGDGTVDITVGDGSQETYIYNQGYTYQNGQWEEYDLSGDTADGSRRWLVGSGEASLNISNSGQNNGAYVVAYACVWENDQWNCGCQSEQCSDNFWQLQLVQEDKNVYNGNADYVEQDGRIIMEVESANANGGWVEEALHGGYTGTGYFTWRGGTQWNNPGNGVLSYTFQVNEGGEYNLRVRNRRDREGANIEDDKANDIWVRMDGGRWNKLFSTHGWRNWGWPSRFDWHDRNGTRPDASYRLGQGTHTLEISGRSPKFKIDRIALFKNGSDGTNTNLPETRGNSADSGSGGDVAGASDDNSNDNEANTNPYADDLISLHYDHAPDKDDGHSAAADRTILETEYGCDFLAENTLAVSGAYGVNANRFNDNSDRVMNTVFNSCGGGWVDAHEDWDQAIDEIFNAWTDKLRSGGDVYVKEGGQSDITADVVRRIQSDTSFDTSQRIHVVQHSDWNENQTTQNDLDYVKANTDYTRISDGNSFLNDPSGGAQAREFQSAASTHPVFGASWRAAFDYLDPVNEKLDFSDTSELMWLFENERSIEEFRQVYLD